MVFTRQYEAYEAYLKHQGQKARLRSTIRRGNKRRRRRLREFCLYFAILERFITHDTKGLCLGARYGEEVQALRDIGYANITGIDIVACPPLVTSGDMNHVDCDNNEYGFIFSNALDHAYSLKTFADEVSRIGRPDAIALFHVYLKNMGAYESCYIESEGEVAEAMAGWRLEHTDDAGLYRAMVFRKHTTGYIDV